MCVALGPYLKPTISPFATSISLQHRQVLVTKTWMRISAPPSTIRHLPTLPRSLKFCRLVLSPLHFAHPPHCPTVNHRRCFPLHLLLLVSHRFRRRSGPLFRTPCNPTSLPSFLSSPGIIHVVHSFTCPIVDSQNTG